jgi:hypothetical protein
LICRSILAGIADRDRLEMEAARAEIASKGTWWAADEITRLRRQLASAKRELQERR